MTNFNERSYQKELLDLAEPELPDDLKIAVIKAMQRMEYRIIGRYVVVTSEVGSGAHGEVY